MFRFLTRIGVLGAVAAAALALSGTALANPSTPTLAPIQPYVIAGPLNVCGALDLRSGRGGGACTSSRCSTTRPARSRTSRPTSRRARRSSRRPARTAGASRRPARVPVLERRAVDLVVGGRLHGHQARDPARLLRGVLPDPSGDLVLTCPPWEIFVGDDPVVQRTRELVANARVLDQRSSATTSTPAAR